MKKKFTLALSALLMAGMAYDINYRQAHTNSAGAPAGHTGSPGDGQSCARSGCHSGGPAQTNETVGISSDIPGTGYVGGTTYNVSVALTKPGGQKFGFQFSAQDGAGNGIGTLVAGSGTQVTGGDYMTHQFSSTSGNGSRTWMFQWTAPSAGSGDVTFYAAGNFSNNQGNSSGDVIVTEAVAVPESSVGITEFANDGVRVFPNPVIDDLHVVAHDVDEEIMVTLFSLDGKKVLEHRLEGEEMSINVKDRGLGQGVYLLNIEIGQEILTRKLLVQ